jgi:hypothetical protein
MKRSTSATVAATAVISAPVPPRRSGMPSQGALPALIPLGRVAPDPGGGCTPLGKPHQPELGLNLTSDSEKILTICTLYIFLQLFINCVKPSLS